MIDIYRHPLSRYLAWILTVCLLSVYPSSVPELVYRCVATLLDPVTALALPETAEAAELGADEAPASRTATSRTYHGSDGRRTSVIYPSEVDYRDKSGRWREIDPRLVVDDISGRFSAQGVPFTASFAHRLGAGALFSADLDGHVLSVSAAGDGGPGDFWTGMDSSLADARRDGVTYLGVSGILDYQLGARSIKETMKLAQPPAWSAIRFRVDGKGLSFAKTHDGRVRVLEAATGDELASLEVPTVTDAAGASGPASLNVIENGRDTILELSLDASWLADPARAYPVTIDPTLILQPDPTAGKDAYVDQKNPTVNYGTNTALYTKGTPSGQYRKSAIRFDLSSIPTSAVVQSATMGLTNIGTTVAMNNRLYRITQTWNETSVTWNTFPTAETNPFLTQSLAASTAGSVDTIDVSAAVKGWVLTPASNFGMAVLYATSTAQRSWYSSDDGTASRRPKLTVVYRMPPSASLTSPADATWVATARPTFSWTYSGDATQADARLQVSTATAFGTTEVDRTFGAPTTSYTLSSTEALTENVAHYWRVKVKDTYGIWSDWTASRHLHVDVTTVTAVIDTPVAGADVRGLCTITGTADDTNFASYDVACQRVGETSWVPIGQTETVPVRGGTLETWSTTSSAEGQYDLRLTARDTLGGVATDTHRVRVDNGTEVAGNITTDTTWTAEAGPYKVTGTVYVVSGRLTIEPGTVVKFYPGTSIDVSGRLVADGTPAAPISFTSIKDDAVGGDTNGDGGASSPAKGDWRQVRILGSASGIFDNCVFRYGGATQAGYPYAGLLYVGAASATITASSLSQSLTEGFCHIDQGTGSSAVRIEDSTFSASNEEGIYTNVWCNGPSHNGNRTLTVANSTVTANSGTGIFFSGCTATHASVTGCSVTSNGSRGVELSGDITNNLIYPEVTAFSSNKLDDNGGYPVYLQAKLPANLPTNRASGNAPNAAYLAGEIPSGSHTWDTSFVPVYVVGGVTVQTTLTVQSGAVLKFPAGQKLSVWGTLDASGSAKKPVYFTSIKDDTVGGDTNRDGSASSPAKGDWAQVGVYNGASATFNHTSLRYGGAGTIPGMLYLSGWSGLGLAHSTVKDSSSNGIYYVNTTSGQGLLVAQDCTVTANTASGIYAAASIQGQNDLISNECRITYNGQAGVRTDGLDAAWTLFADMGTNGTYDVQNESGAQALAAWDWWGRTHKISARIQGNVLYTPHSLFPGASRWLGTGRRPYCRQFGEPVSTVNGNFTSEHADFQIPAYGPPLAFIRSYNSADNAYNGPLGTGWTHNYNTALAENADGSVTVMRADGRRDTFTKNPDGSYSSPSSIFDRLTRTGDTTDTHHYVLSTKAKVRYDFDSGGRMTGIQDRNSNQLTLTYDTTGCLTSVADSAGRALTFAWQDYAGQPRITRVTDPANRSWAYDYAANGNLTSATDPRGGVTRYTYTADQRIETVTDPMNHTYLTNTYDSEGRVVHQTDGNHGGYTFSYEESRTVLTDPEGKVSYHYYDSQAHITKEVDPRGYEANYTYDQFGNRDSITDKRGHTTDLSYDASGNLLSSTDALGNRTDYYYDDGDNLVQKKDPSGKSWYYTYDSTATGNLTKITDPLSHETNMTYDLWGKLRTVEDANHHVSSYSYDGRGNNIAAEDPLHRVTTFSYDIVGRRTGVRDATGQVTRFGYDGTDNLTEVVDARGVKTSCAYDNNGLLVRTEDPKHHTSTYAYDAMDNLLAATDPLGKTETLAYDGNGRVRTRTDRNHHTATYSYDPAGNLTHILYHDGTSAAFTYDENGNRLTSHNQAGTTSYTYDDLNRLSKVTYPSGRTQQYGFDPNGRRSRMTDAAQRAITYSYDDAGKMTGITAPGGKVTSFEYDLEGRRTKTTLPNGAYSSFSHDPAGELTQILQKTSTDTTIAAYGYDYDVLGNRTKLTEADGTNTGYAYDELSRLTQETKRDPGGQTTDAYAYSYDEAGNRTQMVHNGVTTGYTYDNANRITQAGADTYSFDDNGNMVSKVHSGQTTSFTYDPEDQLTQVTSGAATSAYTYGTDGMRVKKVAAGSTTNYYYDGLSPTLETDSSDALKNSYTTDPGSPTGEILFRQDASSAYAYYLSDAIGSTRNLLNDSQQVTKAYSYDAFGNITSQSGSTPNNYTFSGKELDETGLYYFAARYYDATLGRFTSEDPVAADLINPQTIDAFVYCLNNPALLIDPWGLMYGNFGDVPLLHPAPTAPLAPAPTPKCGPYGGTQEMRNEQDAADFVYAIWSILSLFVPLKTSLLMEVVLYNPWLKARLEQREADEASGKIPKVRTDAGGNNIYYYAPDPYHGRL